MTLRYTFAPGSPSARVQEFADYARALGIVAHIAPDCVVLEVPVQQARTIVEIIASPRRAEMGMIFAGRAK